MLLYFGISCGKASHVKYCGKQIKIADHEHDLKRLTHVLEIEVIRLRGCVATAAGSAHAHTIHLL